VKFILEPSDKQNTLAIVLAMLYIGLGIGLGCVLHMFFMWKTQDRQAMAGEWSIAIQTPPCDSNQYGVHYPERDGDVITVYCKTMPVRAKEEK